MENIKTNQSEHAVSFYIIKDNLIALSELSILGADAKIYADMVKNKSDKELFLSELDNCEKIFYFNRLNVPKALRGQGLGRSLMEKTIEFCQDSHAMLVNTVNPYGEMNLVELNHFYESCGMKLVNKKGLLIYSPKLNSLHVNNISSTTAGNTTIGNQQSKKNKL